MFRGVIREPRFFLSTRRTWSSLHLAGSHGRDEHGEGTSRKGHTLLSVGEMISWLHLHTEMGLCSPWLGSHSPAPFLQHRRRRTKVAKQLFVSYSLVPLATCRKTSCQETLNCSWSQRPPQFQVLWMILIPFPLLPPLNLDMAPCCTETFIILKGRLFPSHHTIE